jgi:hypothetical protein
MNKKTILIGGGILAVLGVLWYINWKKNNTAYIQQTNADQQEADAERKQIYDDIYLTMMSFDRSFKNKEGVMTPMYDSEIARANQSVTKKYNGLITIMNSMPINDLKLWQKYVTLQVLAEKGDHSLENEIISDPLKYREMDEFYARYPQLGN